jgi:hypothetical protein
MEITSRLYAESMNPGSGYLPIAPGTQKLDIIFSPGAAAEQADSADLKSAKGDLVRV